MHTCTNFSVCHNAPIPAGPVATRFLKDKLDSVDHAVIVALPTRSLANPVYDVLEGGSSTAQQQGSYLKLFYANAAARQAIGSLDAWLDKHFTLENWVLFSDVLRCVEQNARCHL